MPSIRINNLHFKYSRGARIFENLTLRMELPSNGGGQKRGVVVAVMGASGSGKTTLLRLLAGLEKPGGGHISFEPQDLLVSYLSQEPVLFEHLSRVENARYFQKLGALKRHFDEDFFANTAEKLNLRLILESGASVADMSGGERQRLALLRALSFRPQLLLLDEPCTGLDVPVKQEFLLILREIVDTYGLMAIYVTHHPDETRIIADEILYISRGVKDGHATVNHNSLSEFLKNPPTLEAAQFFATPALNILNCLLDGERLKLENNGTVLGRCVTPIPVPGKYLVAFPPETLRWGNKGVEVISTGSSDQYSFIRVADNITSSHLIGLCERNQQTHVSLRGRALFFNENGEHIQQVIIEEG